MKRAAPTWESSAKKEADQLYLYNSFTRQKVWLKFILFKNSASKSFSSAQN